MHYQCSSLQIGGQGNMVRRLIFDHQARHSSHRSLRAKSTVFRGSIRQAILECKQLGPNLRSRNRLFLSASYVKVGDNGLAHVLLSPASVSSTLSSGNVTVDCTTSYPFANILSYTITSTSSFDFYVRVPQWANLTSSTITTRTATTPLTRLTHRPT